MFTINPETETTDLDSIFTLKAEVHAHVNMSVTYKKHRPDDDLVGKLNQIQELSFTK